VPIVVRRPEALSDLRDISREIRKHNPAASRKVRREVTARFPVLASQPFMGTPYRQGRDLRKHPVPGQPYISFYRPIPGGIEIVRVLDGRRDYGLLI
jgi:toxin ParE1/3/4